MAIDEAILLSFDSSSSLPVLRLYGWSPPTLSLGRFQKATDAVNLARCHAADLSIVRRITGGGIIFHADELTYSIVCSPHQLSVSNSIKESFRLLTQFLLQFYRDLGLNAHYAIDANLEGEKLGERTDFCFSGRESFDILINSRKIGGNAQRRIKGAIFQHGSIPVISRVADGVEFLCTPPQGLEGRVSSLTGEGVAPDIEFLKTAIKKAFCKSRDTMLVDEPLTAVELECASRLKREKYLDDNWNLNGEVI